MSYPFMLFYGGYYFLGILVPPPTTPPTITVVNLSSISRLVDTNHWILGEDVFFYPKNMVTFLLQKN